jgi:hypothetical protein
MRPANYSALKTEAAGYCETQTKICDISLSKNLTAWSESESKLYWPRAAVCRRCYCQLLRIEGVTWSAWRIPILGFLDLSRYFFFQVAPQLYSWGWVDPVSDPLPLWKSGSAGNRTRSSGSVTWNSSMRPQRRAQRNYLNGTYSSGQVIIIRWQSSWSH